MDVLYQAVFASVFAGVVAVDRAAAGQFLFSRPVVAAGILGLLCGCPVEGVIAGLVFELLFLSSLPVGASIPDQALFPALLVVMMIKVNGAGDTLPTAIVLAFPSLFLDRFADRLWRRRNEKTFKKAKVYIRMGREDLAERQHLLAILRAALYHTTAFFVSCVVLIPVYALVVGRMNGVQSILPAAGIVPFLVGLSGLAAIHVKGRGWIGFAIGLAFGALVGIV